MKLFWSIVLSSIAGLSTMLGSLFIFLPIKNTKMFVAFSLSLSMSVMLGISIFDLIPEAMKCLSSLKSIYSPLLVFAVFFIGVGLVYLISKKILKEKGSSLYKVGMFSFIALIIHNLPEGILTFMATYKDFKLGLSICLAIALHNIPEGISIAVPLYYATKNKWKSLSRTFISSLAEPIGAVLTFLILKKYITNEMIGFLLVFVAGIMTNISIEKILPEALSYNLKKPVYTGLIVGFIIVIINAIL